MTRPLGLADLQPGVVGVTVAHMVFDIFAAFVNVGH
jgi:hypothetical protein